jgi:2-amino-4-hydroxy-6-hydroxymethyldihydropteridine diphosphokinase
MPAASHVRITPKRNTVFIALGSNLGNERGDSLAQLQNAVHAIHALDDCNVIACSPVYQSPAHGAKTVQPDYLNAVLQLETSLAAQPLLLALSSIEQKHGRSRDVTIERNAARTLDLDMLLFNSETIHSETLTVPHPRMHLRAFVLHPLLDISPAIMIPGLGAASDFLRGVSIQPITRFSEPLQWI